MSSEVKESKLVISSQKEERWLQRANKCFDDMYNRLNGKLLTTLEVAFPSGKQLEALKARVRDIQGETWDVMQDLKYRYFSDWFSVSDEAQDTKPSEEQFEAGVRKFQIDLMRMIIRELDWFRKIIVNLVVLAIEEQRRQETLKSEIERLIADASDKLRSWLRTGIKDCLLKI